MTLDSVERYVDKSDNFIIDTAAEGKELIILKFTAKNTAAEDDFLNMFYEQSYLDDVAISSLPMLTNVDMDQLWGGVAAGKKRVGYVAYEVPKDWKVLEFQYRPEVFSSQASKMKFVANSSDIK